jgi:hypothetical protein
MIEFIRESYHEEDGTFVPAVGKCHCGEEIELNPRCAYYGGIECPECGQWYNLFGQELNPVETWSQGEDW